VDAGRIPEAHVLSPQRRALRGQLSVRGALVETRAYYVTTIRGLLSRSLAAAELRVVVTVSS
jgi:transposase